MKSQSGFTILELLVAIGVVGVLIAIAVPAYNSYRSKAYDARSLTDLSNVIIAQEAYFLDYDGYADNFNDLHAATGYTTSPEINFAVDSSGPDWDASTYHLKGENTYCYDTTIDTAVETKDGVGVACS